MIDDISVELEHAAAYLPAWAISLAVFAIAIAGALVAHSFLFRFLTRLAAGRDMFWRSVVQRTRRPMMLLAVMVGLMLASAAAPLTSLQADMIRQALTIGLIMLIALIASVTLHIWLTLHLRRFKLDTDDNLMARKHITQSRILKRVADVLIVIIAIGAALMTFESVRQYGVSLLASAGAAGIIIGLALQTVLKNLFAGIQLAITQPIRIDDVVVVEGEWGRIEEITATYVVVKVWDLRRLIVPLSYFIEKPFENWTREGAEILGGVTINLDYQTPVAELRAKAREIVEASPLWDRDVFGVQVIDFAERAMVVRVLTSAANSGNAWDLRCHVREQLVTWLQETYPQSLPRTRIEVDGMDGEPISFAKGNGRDGDVIQSERRGTRQSAR